MSRVYSVTFAGVLGGTLDVDVPAGHTYVIRDIVYTPAPGGGGSGEIVTDGGVTLWYSGPVDPGDTATRHFEGRIVLPELSTFAVTVPDSASMWVSGYDLLNAS